jgi:uncharacterized surface protein with fasciclin (FAS1) repeats
MKSGEAMRFSRTNTTSRTGMTVTGILAGALTLSAAACGSSTPGAGAPGASPTHHPMASHSPAAASATTFGPDCGMVPATGMGSMHGMGMDPVVTAASHNPLLTTLAADVKAAGLTGDLNSMHTITVFAPANTAFAKLPASAMSMLHSRTELAKILKYHVVNGQITPAELAHGMTLTTLDGGTLKGSKMGAVYEVNNAGVICGNIHTANATVYIINKVLIPMR